MTASSKKHLTMRIFGKVQGVFFRVTTKEHAERLGITGFVRNEPDGSVLIEAEGTAAHMKEFSQWCSEGPEGAIVESIIDEEGKVEGYTAFEIEYA